MHAGNRFAKYCYTRTQREWSEEENQNVTAVYNGGA